MADWGAHVRRVVIFRIDSIAYGFLLFLFLQQVKFEWTTRLRFLAFLLLVATTFALLYINGKMLKSDSRWLKEIHPFASAAFGMATLGFFLSLNLLFRGRWRGAVCRYLGQISLPSVSIPSYTIVRSRSLLPVPQ
jgi:hypothetical protein